MVADIIRLHGDGASVRKIAEQVGVSKSTVGNLVARLDWVRAPVQKPATITKDVAADD